MTLIRTNPPAIHQATSFEYQLPACQQHKLGNNQSLYTVKAGTQPVISFEIYIPKRLNNVNDVAIAKGTVALLKAGTSTLTALQISNKIEQLGAELHVTQNNDYLVLKLQCLNKHFKELVSLIFEIIRDAQFPASEIEIFRQQALQHLMINLKKSDFVANRKNDELIYGFGHPYGSYSNIEDYERLTRKDLQDYHHDNFSLAHATFFLSGLFNAETINLIKHELTTVDLISRQKEDDILVEHPDPTKKHRIINDENALQGAIRVSKKFIDKEHPDFIPMLFVNTLFGGYFGSRLMSNIREDKGYTYGIYSFVQQNRHCNSYIIATDVGKDDAEQAVDEVWNEMNILKTELVKDDELHLVKNYILGSILGSLDGPFKIMSRWKSLILNGHDASYFDKSIEIYKNITAQEIQALANQYYQQADFYDLIVY